jgi:type IV secretion system protein VirD4
MNRPTEDEVVFLFCIVVFLVALHYRQRRRPTGTAYGTATFASDDVLRAAGMLADRGLILGRTFGGALIRLPHYCHLLLIGGSGSGKGVSIILTNLLTYVRGSIVCFDTKGDLYATAGHRRAAMGQRIIRIAPFNGGEDSLNILDTIPSDSPLLVDLAKAMAEALVVRQHTEPDPHWNEKSVQVICALLVLVLLLVKDEERNLSSVQEIASDPDLLKAAGNKLRELGGIPARLGAQLTTLFDKQTGGLTKEGASVVSTVSRHLSFLDSELVAKAVSRSTFDPQELLKPGRTLFIQIPPDQLDAQKGFLRCMVSTLVRVIGARGNEQDNEVLMLLDEASALGSSLPAIEEALVRGRSAGVRILLAYQSDSQVRAAFNNKPTLLYDNCSAQIYLGAASSYETAERVSKSLGEWTQVVESYGSNESRSWQEVQPGGQSSRGSSQNYSLCEGRCSGRKRF